MLASKAIGSTVEQKRKERSDPSAEEQLYLDETPVRKKRRDGFSRTLQIMQDEVVRLLTAEERMPQRSQIAKSKGGGGASICEHNRKKTCVTPSDRQEEIAPSGDGVLYLNFSFNKKIIKIKLPQKNEPK